MTEQIAPTLAELKKNFNSQITKPIAYRKEQLRRLRQGIDEMKDEFCQALYKDLGRCEFFTWLGELKGVIDYCDHFLGNIDTFAQDVYFDPPLLLAPNTNFIRYEPLGVALIYGSWNYPYYVTLKPLAQAICSGNCAIIKPSELSPQCSAVTQKLFEKYLDQRCYRVIQGDVQVSIEIGKQPFDIVCFTGSTEKGKLVARAAAANLIPCVLELGGKCPLIVDTTANVDYAAFKCVSAKFQNAGQTCLTVDYVLVHESKEKEFIERVKWHIKDQYNCDPSNPKSMRYTPDVGRIVASFHLDRVEKIMKEVESNPNTKTEIGGSEHIYREDLYVAPTVYSNLPANSAIMTEEIFAPILPIVTFKNFDEVVDQHILSRGKPLAIYYFGARGANYDRIRDCTSSGNCTLNDILFQTLAIDLGFGGVGASGYGRYGGYEGFKQWSNPKSVVEKVQLNIWPITYFAAPWDETKQAFIRTLFKGLWLKQNFILGGIVKLIALYFGVHLLLGEMGDCQLRKDMFSAIVAFLVPYTK